MPVEILVVMAVFRPNRKHLEQQLRSVADQTFRNIRLIAVIADCQSAAMVDALTSEMDLACSIVTPDHELDAVRAFEAGLEQAVSDAGQITGRQVYVALSDQDDIWHPNRLQRGLEALQSTGAALVHSDARLVDAEGALLHASMFAFENRQRRPGLRDLLYRNTITGMTVLMRMDVLRVALPFPAQDGAHFYHDFWLGLVAQASGGVHLIEDQLVDYRQHDQNAIGAVDRRQAPRAGLVKRLRGLNMSWLRQQAASYGLARYLALSLQARVAEAEAAGLLTADTKRLRDLTPYFRRVRGKWRHMADALRFLVTGHPDLARIAASFWLVTFGRLVWAGKMVLGEGLTVILQRFDDRLYSLSPGVSPAASSSAPAPSKTEQSYKAHVDMRKEPGWTPQFGAEHPALNILVPSLNPSEIFAGIVTALDIGTGLAARGYSVRFIATDMPMASPAASRAFVLGRLDANADTAGAAARITLFNGVGEAGVPANRDDLFLATAWWSAHAADRTIRRNGYFNDSFLYLIQDYEPNFYPWGQEYADATASYGLKFQPVFNTTLLRDFFADRGYPFATDKALSFHPSIDIARYASGRREQRADGPRRLALYGRPEVPRNMFATAIEALSRFIQDQDIGPKDLEILSVGLPHAPISMPGGITVQSLGKLPWEDYPKFLLGVDFGLSLMHSPHPSHPPIEMAASGVRVVTNTFGPKDLSALSPAILSCEGTAPALGAALSRAWTMPPVSPQERDIDLTRIGLSPGVMIDRLASDLADRLPRHQDAEE